MVKGYKELIGDYFAEHSIVESNIKSFNNFMERRMQEIIDEANEIIPTIIPSEVQDFKIKLGKIKIPVFYILGLGISYLSWYFIWK